MIYNDMYLDVDHPLSVVLNSEAGRSVRESSDVADIIQETCTTIGRCKSMLFGNVDKFPPELQDLVVHVLSHLADAQDSASNLLEAYSELIQGGDCER